MAVMGIDMGNTNVKCIVLDANGITLALSTLPTNIRQGGSFNGNAIMHAIKSLCENALAQIPGVKIEGMAVSTMGSAAIMLDENGDIIPQIDLPPWDGPMPNLSEEEYFSTCGYPKDYYHDGIYLAHLSHTRPDLFRQVKALLSVGDYIAYRLSGKMVNDISTAGSFSIVEMRTGKNWRAFVDEYKLPIPHLVQSGAFVGEVANDFGLPMGTPVFAGGHDYLCAAFAAGCVNPGDAINVLGTFEMMASFYDTPQPPITDAFAFMDSHVCPGVFTQTTENNCGNSIAKAISQGEKSGLSGKEMFALLGKNDARATELERAITDINKTSVEMLRVHQKAAGKNDLRIKVVGGGSSNPFWMQDKANTMGLPLYVPKIEEASATGAALLAGCGSGMFANHKQAAQTFELREEKIYQPQV